LDSRLRRQLALITVTRLVLNTMFRFVYPFLPVLGRGLGVSISTLSIALSGRSFAGSVGPFFAALTEGRGRRFGMLSGLAIFLMGLVVVMIWPSFLTFSLALILTSFGKAIFDPSIQAYLGDQVPYAQRGLALGISEFGWSLSIIIGVPLVGLLIARQGWLAPFPVLVIATLICLGLLAWQIPQDIRPAIARSGLGRNLRLVFASPAALISLLVAVLISGANELVNLIFGVWIESSLGLQIAALGAASLVIGVAELAGEALVSGLTDRLGKTRAVVLGLILNSLAALLLPVLGQNMAGAFLGLFLFYLTFEYAVVSFIPLMSEVLPAARATFLALNFSALLLGRAVGAILAPPLFFYGITATSLSVAVLNLAAILLLWVFSRKALQPA
jgi:predicted MFS family arabinose efflux permease